MAYDPNEDFGGAFTGRQTPGTAPLQSIMAPAVQPPATAGFLSDPKDQAALLQIGLQLMQPPEWGQTTAGAIGSALGAGGEAIGRREKQDLEAQNVDIKAQRAEDMARLGEARIAQADRRLQSKQLGGISAGLDYRMSRDAQQDALKTTQREDERLLDRAESLVQDPLVKTTDPKKQQYVGKDKFEIYDMLKADRARIAGGGATAAAPTATAKDGRKVTWNGANWVDDKGAIVK